MTKPKDADAVMKMMKDKEVKYVDLRFTDPRGKMQHVTFDISQINEEAFAEGLMFDGSSIAGWKAINESDMVLMPDPTSAHMDPFYAQTTMAIFCDILEPTTGEGYNRDPRMICQARRSLSQADQGRRHDLCRPGSRVLHVRRRALLGDALQYRLQGQLGRTADQQRHRIRGRQSRPPDAHQGRLFPDEPAGFRAGHALGNALGHGRDGRHRRKAPSRGGRGPARARHEIRHARIDGRPDADLQVCDPQCGACLWQVAPASCRSRSSATTARACIATSRSGRTASRRWPATSMPTSRSSASISSAA